LCDVGRVAAKDFLNCYFLHLSV